MKEHEATTHHIAIVCHISGCYALDSVPKTSSGHSPEGALSFSCAGGLVWRSAGSTVNMGRRTKDVGWKHFVPDWRERPFWNCIDSILVLCLGAHLVYYLRVHRVNSPLNLFKHRLQLPRLPRRFLRTGPWELFPDLLWPRMARNNSSK